MTQYKKKNISGDAAEYFVAYTVTKKLGWPCRLIGVDLGIDGEIEIIDNQGRSDGDLIKIQIKGVASMPAKGRDIYVTDDHIKYWKNFSAPIVVCCVDHKNEVVYWKPIYQTEAYLTKGMSKKIRFKPTDNKLDVNSKDHFRNMVTPPQAKNFAAQLTELRDYLDHWAQFNGIDGSDDKHLIKVENRANQIFDLVRKLREERHRFPWRFGPLDVQVIDAAAKTAQWVLNTSAQAATDWAY